MDDPSSRDLRKLAQGQYRTTQSDWDKLAPYIKFRYSLALDYMPKDKPVYELGCGIGVGLHFLAANRPDLTFVGLDNSEAALEFARANFGKTSNLTFQHSLSIQGLASMIKPDSYMIAFEVIEHLDDQSLDMFKYQLLTKISGAIFSYPYNQQDIAGTDHLQSIDIYKTFEIFPGFTTLFIRRGSLKFIGHWIRRRMPHIGVQLGVAGELEAIKRIANWQ